MLKVEWKQGLVFEGHSANGHPIVFDGADNESVAPSPVEGLMASMAACSAIDVVMILEKMRQVVDGYHVEVEWTRIPAGTYPRPVTSAVMRHMLRGSLDPAAVEKAVRLSGEKYCSVLATLRLGPTVTSEYRIDP